MESEIDAFTPMLARSENTLTNREAQDWFRAKGIAINQWSEERGFNTSLVYAVLQGKRKCLRGQSHQIAVALGLKPAA
jgi:gp16 family phage-associated protein